MPELESVAAQGAADDCVWRNLPLVIRIVSLAVAGLACLILVYGVLIAPLGEGLQLLCVAAFATAATLQVSSFFYACWHARD